MPDWELFRGLPEAELRRLVAVARRRHFERREVVFHRGDPADTLHLVSRGHFAVRVTTGVGDTTTIGVHGPGEGFGELALVEEGSARSTTVAALEQGETFAVHRDDFTRLRQEYPSVNDVLVRLLAARLRRASDLLVEALFVPADTRVLRRVLELSRLYGQGAVPLSQQELAAKSGKDRTVIARWEQGVVAPSIDTLVELLRSCGYDIPLELVPYDPGPDERIREIQMLSPERRVNRLLGRREREGG